MNNNLLSIKYFIYITSLHDYFYYLPIEIRKIIWIKYNTLLNIKCYICNSILINLNIYNINYNGDNFSIINGIVKCNRCFID